ncbi:MFS transporter [Jeotgalibaca sp. A122]|uniref:MFS transporter n=1 Tax=Jeotgalibaca sp. A122 TaxID=3457322 RepID=UPI003FD27CCB
MSDSTSNMQEKYHTAKWWQIVLFSLNNSSTNLYLFAFGFVTYYSTGLVGLAALFISQLMGYVRIFDGIIDPAIGVFIDKTETRWGKYRPLMLMGNLITIASFLILFTTHLLPEPARLPVLVVALIIHKIGYSLQASVTKAGQSVLTSDPKQRPMFNISDGIFMIFVFTGGQIYASNYLEPKYGGFTLGFFQELVGTVIVVSLILCILAIIGISAKDQKQYFGLGENTTETSLKDYAHVIKGNRPLQMLSMAAAFVKFCVQLMSDQVAQIIVFGILLGNFALSGQMSMLTIIPDLLITFGATALARKKGLRGAYIIYLSLASVFFVVLGMLMMNIQPGDVDFGNITFKAVLFISIYALARGFSRSPSSLVLTMSADISDYETSESGRYVAGVIGTIFSLTDSLASSLAPMMIGWLLAAVGFGTAYPTADTPLSGDLRMIALLLYAVLPFISIVIALVFMKFYKLDSKAMEGVQERLSELRSAESPVQESEVEVATTNN